MIGEECGHVGRRDGARGEGASKREEVEEGCLCCDQPITLPPSCRTVSTTVDPFRDISLDLAPSMVTNRTSTPIDINGTCT